MAEGEGFKPPIPERGIPDFESSAIDHSANLPSSFADAKVIYFSELAKLFFEKNEWDMKKVNKKGMSCKRVHDIPYYI